jgi:hypothetical protein
LLLGSSLGSILHPLDRGRLRRRDQCSHSLAAIAELSTFGGQIRSEAAIGSSLNGNRHPKDI